MPSLNSALKINSHGCDGESGALARGLLCEFGQLPLSKGRTDTFWPWTFWTPIRDTRA